MANSTYDEALKARLKLLQSHPNYLPYIGKKYEEATTKIAIVAESHYLPKRYNHQFTAAQWYHDPKSVHAVLDQDKDNPKGWCNTRGVVNYYLSAATIAPAHRIFSNLEKAFQELHKERKLLEECVYLNYFQRPSEKEGDSITIHQMDSAFAVENIMALVAVLQPDKIIFVSSKAHADFIKNTTKFQREKLPYIGAVPHPSASSWWNRKSPKYGLKGQSATGKEKFLRIIKPKDTHP